MSPTTVKISHLTPQSPEIGTIADWRHHAWLDDLGFTRGETHDQLRTFVASTAADKAGPEIALMAEIDGSPVGTCLLVREEIDACHDVTPWLAGLYVTPAVRRQGVGGDLVRAIERHGRSRGVSRLHLYTIGAEGFYARLGWQVGDRFDHHGERFVHMHTDL